MPSSGPTSRPFPQGQPVFSWRRMPSQYGVAGFRISKDEGGCIGGRQQATTVQIIALMPGRRSLRSPLPCKCGRPRTGGGGPAA